MRLKIWLALPAGLVLIMSLIVVFGQWRVQAQEFPAAQFAPDWLVLAQQEIVSVVTTDSDGERRVTQLWIAAVAEQPYLRTSDTRWYRNLQRSPQLTLRIGGHAYACASREVEDEGVRAAVHAAFSNKYPRRSRMFRAFGIRTDRVLALAC